MNGLVTLAVLLLVMALAYRLGLARSLRVAKAAGGARALHSRPVHYGVLAALWCGVPALVVLLLWTLAGERVLLGVVAAGLPPDWAQGLDDFQMRVLLDRIAAISKGEALAQDGALGALQMQGAAHMAALRQMGQMALAAVMALLAAGGLWFAYRRIAPALRARNEVEAAVRVLLALCSVIAIVTTLGIVLSLLGEAVRFFQFVAPADFFLGTVWDPHFSSADAGGGAGDHGQFGLLPLLWGTLMVSAIALVVAVPTGLMMAIYLAEYAPRRVRNVAKPVIEVLAGIPTIVYGFFALLAVGPFLHAAGQWLGLEIRAASALSAGVAMGVMIIPFISSLSDDILTQVPRALRDGSYGLGATQSETIVRVVLPAALPGIVGAFLLAASRAIGETMIVVLAAGNSPVLHANPLESVSTVTVTIVNQLTGDLDFAGPQSLVAFALGLTLFAITLALNIVALYIVRKYREQYD